MDQRAIILCKAADAATAEALASTFPGGAGSFGPGARRVSTDAAATIDNPTDLCVSGAMPEEMVRAFRISTAPFYMVIDNPDDLNPWPILGALNPPLYPCVDNQVV